MSTLIGLISDTHMPMRWRQLPTAVFEIFRGVDLLLHAGDVGELWVLDQLSQIAPVIAVHGNDETKDATRALPYLQTVIAEGQRIVLTHGHYSDRAEELEQRKDDAWQPKLARLAQFGAANGASMVVFGHSHIPLVTRTEDIWLINPGAIASGGLTVRQKRQSVALLELESGKAPRITHFDLNNPQSPFQPAVDLTAGFNRAIRDVTESILEPALEREIG